MAEAAVTLNNKTYKFTCGDAEVARLRELSQVVSTKLDALVAEYGQVGDERLLLLAALQIADELLDAQARVDTLETALSTARKNTRTGAA